MQAEFTRVLLDEMEKAEALAAMPQQQEHPPARTGKHPHRRDKGSHPTIVLKKVGKNFGNERAHYTESSGISFAQRQQTNFSRW